MSSEEGTAASSQQLLAGLRALGDGLAFNQHVGTTVGRLAVGEAETVLSASDALDNHVGGVHAVAALAPVELAGALAATSRLAPVLERGYVPVVGELTARYLAPAQGELRARAAVGADAVAPALAALEAGYNPRVTAEVEVVDPAGVVVLTATLTFVFIPPPSQDGTAAG